MFMVCLVLQVVHGEEDIRCIPEEREALLQFKTALVLHSGMLSSWSTPHCCQWQGIRCSNLTAHILSLHIHGEVRYLIYGRYISGEIHKSLMELRELEYLNLSSNSFPDSHIPEFLGSLRNLRYLDLSSCHFGGKIPSQLGSLSHLKYLNLAWNSLEGSIPPQLGNLSHLQYLDLRYNSFEGNIPSQLGNLSNLQELYLGGYYHDDTLKIDDGGQWLSNLISLTHLYLRSISNLREMIAKLPNLRELSLVDCSLSDHFILSWRPFKLNFSTSLSVLHLSENSFTSPMIFQWVSNISSNLVELDFSFNLLEGSTSGHSHSWFQEIVKLPKLRELRLVGCSLSDHFILSWRPSKFNFSASLSVLDLSWNTFTSSMIFPWVSNITSELVELGLSYNNLNVNLLMIIHHLSGCARNSLKILRLDGNNISGTLIDLSIFSTLQVLDLSYNQLNGEIPKDIPFPPQLEVLDMQSNFLKGLLTDYHFINMSKLINLDLSDNSLALAFSHNWVPPFQLHYIGLRSCNLGPTFPKWLKTQNEFHDIDISNATISDIVPEWFWVKLQMLEYQIVFLNISYNNLGGVIPNFPQNNSYYSVSLGSNQLEGPIPIFLRNSFILDLSKNKFSDSNLFLCANGTIDTLHQLDLSNNQFSGQIPNCWNNFKSLAYLDLSDSKFSGKVPTSMGSLVGLQALFLRNNNLVGGIPSSLRNCTELVMLDMSKNKLSGPIPNWIGTNKELQILSLGGNQFYGSLPFQICCLINIHILDLSLNNLSGQIPKCITNLSSMAQSTSSIDNEYHRYFLNTSYLRVNRSYQLNALLMWKGLEQKFQNKGLSLLKSIDLSSNHFVDEIPLEIEKLSGLISLNLSRNNLSGKIPPNIGKLASLESLDLSRNQLDGLIPPTLTQIHGLSVLDLSHNRLRGEIPTSTQLQSFNSSSYEDNSNLCGAPLEKLCIEGGTTQEPKDEVDEEDSFFNNEFLMSMGLGFVVSFWMVFGSILFKRSWRHAYFQFLNNLADNIHIKIALLANYFKLTGNNLYALYVLILFS
ncbi:unnamed protein product [Sphenostylis stenocarpa]|uniref:Uncharacterized protein n=1 Tax=Sphenostylis stenocarpa TaxID=92480 RepID=A0AA86SGW7_9FABA|nr:unnamed protein product [Sphenostylis stenocarpa]